VQVVPQEPQLVALKLLLVTVLTQVPLHTVGEFVGHAQTPFWHV
jgi:hypothetical protein